jgi:hypothetical protein
MPPRSPGLRPRGLYAPPRGFEGLARFLLGIQKLPGLGSDTL